MSSKVYTNETATNTRDFLFCQIIKKKSIETKYIHERPKIEITETFQNHILILLTHFSLIVGTSRGNEKRKRKNGKTDE